MKLKNGKNKSGKKLMATSALGSPKVSKFAITNSLILIMRSPIEL